MLSLSVDVEAREGVLLLVLRYVADAFVDGDRWEESWCWRRGVVAVTMVVCVSEEPRRL